MSNTRRAKIEALSNLLELDKLESRKFNKQELLKGIASYQKPDRLIAWLRSFTKFGNINHEDALLTIAQTASRKPYLFNPTLLEKDEVNEYFAFLRDDCPHPLRERLIISGQHWICGDIQIDHNGHVDVLLLDSSGDHHLELQTEQALSALHSVFSGKSLHVYFDPTIRQRTVQGCSVFALDDLRHLFTLEQYLGENLFDYLRKSFDERKQYVLVGDHEMREVELPLALMRTMQHKDLLEIIEARDEGQAVNKHKKTATQEAKNDFKDENGKPKNRRLERKLAQMKIENLNFLLKNKHIGLDNINEECNQFLFSTKIEDKLEKSSEKFRDTSKEQKCEDKYDIIYTLLMDPESICKEFIESLGDPIKFFATSHSFFILHKLKEKDRKAFLELLDLKSIIKNSDDLFRIMDLCNDNLTLIKKHLDMITTFDELDRAFEYIDKKDLMDFILSLSNRINSIIKTDEDFSFILKALPKSDIEKYLALLKNKLLSFDQKMLYNLGIKHCDCSPLLDEIKKIHPDLFLSKNSKRTLDSNDYRNANNSSFFGSAGQRNTAPLNSSQTNSQPAASCTRQ